MERRGYIKQLCAWWESLETEADNLRINPSIFKPQPNTCPKPSEQPQMCIPKPEKLQKYNAEDCYIIREALQKLNQFLAASHQNGCNDKRCKYNPINCMLKTKIKQKNVLDFGPNTAEIKIKKKRGRKSMYELQQIALLKAAKGV